jgi:hypothetical protein
MEGYRRSWNKRQPELRRLLLSFTDHQKAMELFLSQHAMLHSAAVAHSEPWSFEDEILDDMTEAHIRRIPHNCAHSVAWLIWHIARIEDVTMNLLLAGTSQVLYRGDWLAQMKIEASDVGTGMGEAGVADLSARVDIDALRAYRLAVGRRTREIAKQIQPEELKQKPDAARLQRVNDEGAVVEAALGLIDTWGKWKKVRLLAMPATRHSYTHLNEALRVKRRGH